MKKSAALLAAVLLLSCSVAFASGFELKAVIPLKNTGLPGVYMLLEGSKVIDEVFLGEGCDGSLCANLKCLGNYEFTIKQKLSEGNFFSDSFARELPKGSLILPEEEPVLLVPDESEYIVRISVFEAESGASYVTSAEKKGEDGKSEEIVFYNYAIEHPTLPKTGDSNPFLWLLPLAVSLAALVMLLFRCLPK